VAIPGVLPAYITVEQYQANRARLAANAARAETPGVARAGSALLSGLARCGRCGRRMTVRYHLRGQATVPEYVCARQQTDYGQGERCQALAGACVDALVTGQVLAALTPAAVEVSLGAAQQLTAERAELERLWQQRLERAQVAVDRARRCYRLAEPENRLVVRQLEADWEAALAAEVRLREDYDRFTHSRPQPLTPAQQQAITALAADIEGLWAASTTTDADRKQLIRALVDQVTITVAGTSERVAVDIGWAGGHTTHGQTIRPVARLDQLSSYPQLLERVRQLAEQATAPAPSPTGCTPRASARPRDASASASAPSPSCCTSSAIPGPTPASASSRRPVRNPAPASGGWTTWPPSSPCRPSPCTPGSAAAGSTPARNPAAPTAGSSTPTPTNSPSFAGADPARLAGTPADAGPTQRHQPRMGAEIMQPVRVYECTVVDTSPPASGTLPPSPERPTAGRPGRSRPRRLAHRSCGCGGPAASAGQPGHRGKGHRRPAG
jgi:hypothetical protein